MLRRLYTVAVLSAIAVSSGLNSKAAAQIKAVQQEPKVSIPEISTRKSEKMVNVGGRALNSCVYGQNGPTVVLVSGLRAPQAYWNPVIPDLAAKTTVVTFDRAGMGKSEIGDLPTHGLQTVEDMHILLEKLAVPEPYILVGHSYGGDIVRLFASTYPDLMGGLILEDTQHEDILEEQMKMLKGKDLEMLEEMVARFGTPDDPITELDYRNITRDQVRNSGPLPQIPFVVITSGDRSRAMPPMFSEDAKKELAGLGLELQERLVALIPEGRHIVVEGVGHNIHAENPDALIGPVIDMISDIRE